ncbi:MAG: methylamine utilization protein [Burkholderiales bacterium]
MSRGRALYLAALLWAASWATQAATVTVNLHLPGGAPVEDAVVWLEGAPGADKLSGRPVEIQQIDQEFTPFVTVVATGTRVLFPNRDKVKHHVYSFSPAKSFEIQLYSGTPTEPVVFDKAGVVAMGCNIHDWMLAYVVVVDSPWFAKSAGDGRAQLTGLPPGHYTLHIWHPFQKSDRTIEAIDLASTRALRETQVTLDLAPSPKKARRPLGETY